MIEIPASVGPWSLESWQEDIAPKRRRSVLAHRGSGGFLVL